VFSLRRYRFIDYLHYFAEVFGVTKRKFRHTGVEGVVTTEKLQRTIVID
jgi:hypothetical protein